MPCLLRVNATCQCLMWQGLWHEAMSSNHLVLKDRNFLPYNSAFIKTLKCSQGIKEREKKLWKVFILFVKKKKKNSFIFFNHYQNLLQTHRPYSIPIKLYRASPALDCQWGPSVLIYRPRKHSTIMVINNNRIQYMTTWMMEPLRIHLHCFVLQSSCL